MDYSEFYYTKILKKEIPAKCNGKFVQITNEDTGKEYIVLSPRELSVHHANIVERFMLNRGKGTYNQKKDFFTIHNPEWVVVGGGIWAIDYPNKVLNLFGTSQCYGEFDSTGLKKKILTIAKMMGFTIIIDGI
ncbi:MAG: hypothetical protein COZ31_09485 [Nitrospirae bacterium CG_4_10_14_3_um_filter_44_29]|nr:hypothetical protein [Nitrospirota bacterium]PIV67635.1 MAG: hypothetical protein COS10_00100 [Nitrospirae bacterium CG01_land_8_20_14_3_00_44_22]PIW89022.1 MAG: hypothetical protein COZ93_07380 [Nitrospirae bacterium CG_4_8_14_3_um_filter_44_28]PIX87622.1 MAG: hypothetical protein COZ31_09485 [Nitrospirae bacterium CG_4_10_14_3_um_filter_44_29]